MEREWQTEPKQTRWSRGKYEGRGFAVSELVEEQSEEYVALCLGHLLQIFHPNWKSVKPRC